MIIRVCRVAAVAALGLAFSSSANAQRRPAPLPTPESSFGYRVGADSLLVDYDQSIGYFRKLAAASNRVKLITVGTTSYGKSWTAVVISSPENLAQLERYKKINQQIAHPAGLTDSSARRLARDGKVFVDISGGLHASEIAGSQHTPQLAYELLSRANEPAMKAIFDNVIFFLWPSINPDGQDIVVKGCRDRYAGRPASNELYQKYVGHDNNRDSYMLNVVESRVIAHTWREWEPEIVYVHHQSPPQPYRIWIPPFANPIGLHAPPIISATVNVIGTRIAAALAANDQPGAVHMLDTFDAYYPGYIDYMPVFQNAAAWWTETQGAGCATPSGTAAPITASAAGTAAPPRATLSGARIPVDPTRAATADLPAALYVAPWPGGRWTLRDAVDYMVTASIATLDYAARYKDEVLYNRYQAGRNTIAQYANNAPYAYIIPQDQRDPMAPVELLRRLAFLGVRVSQTTRDITYGGAEYPKGTWIVPMDQEYAQLVRELLDVQVYPRTGDDTPYDAAGWTLPFQMGVTVVTGTTPLSADIRAALSPVSGKPTVWGATPDYPFTTSPLAVGIVPKAGAITGSGTAVSLDPAQNNSFRFINRAVAAGGKIQSTLTTNGLRYLVSGVDSAKLAGFARDLYVTAERVTPSGSTAAVPMRIALYKAGAGNMDEGWTEWLFDTHEFSYTLIGPSDLRGDLGARFDAIVIGGQSVGGGGGRGGRGGGGGPGGAGGRGAGGGGAGAAVGGAGAAAPAAPPVDSATMAIDQFVRGGGTVVTWNGGANAMVGTLKIPVRNVVAGVARTQYFTGISVFETTTDPSHPVMAGMPEHADVVVSGSPAFTTLDGFEGSVVAKYPVDRSPLRSGFLLGDQLLRGYATAVDAKVGEGHAILLAFQPEWRGQSTGSFRAIFNSVLFSRTASAGVKGAAGFWVPK